MLRRLFRKISEYFNERRYCRQRAKQGYGIMDLWDIDLWFLDIMPRMLTEFKKHVCGVPEFFIADVKKELNIENDQDFDFEIAEKKWLEVIGHMIFLFNLI